MSRPVGRHRVRRETGLRALRRPAVAATAAISAVSVSAAGYATASSAVASSSAGATMQTGAQASGAALGAANAAVVADASAQLMAKNAAVAARAAAVGKSKSQLVKQRAHSAALQTKAEKAASAKRSSVARAKAAAAAKAKAAAAAKAKAEAAAKRNRDTQSVSRSSERPPAAQTPTYSGSPQAIASSMLASYGWGQDQMGCLTALWNKESGWNVYASNPGSGAYGIPQSLPGSKMASAGADWRTNPATQIRWGLGYIRSSYGSPCGAWGHSQATNWY